LREGLVFAVLWGVPFALRVALSVKLTSAAEAIAAGFGYCKAIIALLPAVAPIW
jgi:hypothetical protein